MGRIVAGAIALIYLLVTYAYGGAEPAFKMATFLILPLACIWFSSAMGGYTGVGFGRGPITSTSPGCFVAFGGWLLLLVPLIVGIVQALSGE